MAESPADPDIRFDAAGVCNYCHDGDAILRSLPRPRDGERQLLPLVEHMRRIGHGAEYDALIGLSGGVDSSYAAAVASRYGVRALAVHFDNGWNSELAVENIQRVVEGCGFDLMTYVIDWPEFRDLQRAFFKASVIDIEMITDHAIYAALIRLADEHRIPFILSGLNMATEHGMPRTWLWNKQDWMNIKAIHDQFGSVPLRTFPHVTRRRWLVMRALRRKPWIADPLERVPYRRDHAAAMLEREFGWREYGGKHHESVFTRFYQAWILPTKFGVDKRRVHLSARIRNGELTRSDALAELEIPIYTPEVLASEREFVLKKLGFGDSEFDAIMAAPPRRHDEFATDKNFLNLLRLAYRPIQLLRRLRTSTATRPAA
jgi:N-acetyl sugar amidotransferase